MNGTFIRVDRERSHFNRAFNAECVEFVIRIKDPNDVETVPYVNLYEWHLHVFEEMLEWGIRRAEPHHFVGIKIGIPDAVNTRSIGLDFRPISSLSAEILADLLQNVMQSNDEFGANSRIEINMTIVRIPSGGAMVKLNKLNKNNILHVKSRSIVVQNGYTFDTEDRKCLARSLVLGKAVADNKTKKQMSALIRRNSQLLKCKTDLLIERANVVVDVDVGCELNDVYQFSKVMKNYEIVIYDSFVNPGSILFRTMKKPRKIALFYMADEKHFITIKKVNAFFGFSYQCDYCDKLYQVLNKHRCTEVCSYCRQIGPCPSVPDMTFCEICRRSFRGDLCYRNHIERACAITKHKKKKNDGDGDVDGNSDATTVCQQLKICENCFLFIDTRRKGVIPHVCTDKWCSVCSRRVSEDHQCYIQKFNKSPPEKWVLIFYDFETTCEESFRGVANTFVHKPNLCVANQICYKCHDRPNDDVECDNCVQRTKVFEGFSCVKEFVDFVEEYRPYSCNKVTVIAHNAKSFDLHFIMSEMLDREKPVKLILGGRKILFALYNNCIRFVDSFNFIPMALASFVDAFDLSNDLSKTDYPYKFNTTANYSYEGPIPGLEYYDIDRFKGDEEGKKKEAFLKWHKNHVDSNYVFNNRNELIKYCKNDVQLLQEGCLKFMESFITLTGISPFLQCMTLAQTVSYVYRRNFMPERSLGIIPKNNYRSQQNQSVIGRKWLVYQNMIQPYGHVEMETTAPGTRISVDGINRERGNLIFEFQGCHWHGHVECLSNYTPEAYKQNTGLAEFGYHERRDRTAFKMQRLKELNFTVESIYECEFNKFLKENPEIHAKINASPEMLYTDLNIRDSLYGGRCEPFSIYYKVKPNEKIYMYDVVSLYPFCNGFGTYCVGHPRVYRGAECEKIGNFFELEGVVKCRIKSYIFHCVVRVPIRCKHLRADIRILSVVFVVFGLFTRLNVVFYGDTNY